MRKYLFLLPGVVSVILTPGISFQPERDEACPLCQMEYAATPSFFTDDDSHLSVDHNRQVMHCQLNVRYEDVPRNPLDPTPVSYRACRQCAEAGVRSDDAEVAAEVYRKRFDVLWVCKPIFLQCTKCKSQTASTVLSDELHTCSCGSNTFELIQSDEGKLLKEYDEDIRRSSSPRIDIKGEEDHRVKSDCIPVPGQLHGGGGLCTVCHCQ